MQGIFYVCMYVFICNHFPLTKEEGEKVEA